MPRFSIVRGKSFVIKNVISCSVSQNINWKKKVLHCQLFEDLEFEHSTIDNE